MRREQNKKNKVANAVIEYAITLAIVAAAFTGMNIYLKRGMQAKLADMTDHFISNEQLVELEPSSSSQNRVTDTDIVRRRFKGGGTRIEIISTDNIVQEGEVSLSEESITPDSPSNPSDYTGAPPYTANPSAGLPGQNRPAP